MDILCINYEYPPIGGGGATACKGLAEALVSRGNSMDLVTSGMKDLTKQEVVNGVNLHRVSCFRRHRHYVTIPELITQINSSYKMGLELTKKKKYRINHTHFIIPSGLTSYLIWRKTGLPYVITAHGSDIPGYNPDRFQLAHKISRPLWKEIIKHAECIISPSNYLKELLLSNVDTKVSVIPNGIAFPDMPAVQKRNRIIVVTRMFKRKGVQHFLRAIDGLDTDWEICIAGDGPYLQTLKEMAGKIRKKIEFLGFIKGQELFDLYQSAKIYVFPSIQENFPVVLLEAMKANCAIITTTASGCAEVTQDAGIKIEPGNVDRLREAIRLLINSPAEIERLTALGRKRLKGLTWKCIAEAHEGVFQKYGK